MGIAPLAQNIYVIATDPDPTPGIWSDRLYAGGLPKAFLEVIYSILSALGWSKARSNRRSRVMERIHQKFLSAVIYQSRSKQPVDRIQIDEFNRWLYPVLKRKVWPSLSDFISRYKNLSRHDLSDFLTQNYIGIRKAKALQAILSQDLPADQLILLEEGRLGPKESTPIRRWIQQNENEEVRKIHRLLKRFCFYHDLNLFKLENALLNEYEMTLLNQPDPVYLQWVHEQPRPGNYRFGINEATLGIEKAKIWESEPFVTHPEQIKTLYFHPLYLIEEELISSLAEYPWEKTDKLTTEFERKIAFQISYLITMLMLKCYTPEIFSPQQIFVVRNDGEPFLRAKEPYAISQPDDERTYEPFIQSLGNRELSAYILQTVVFPPRLWDMIMKLRVDHHGNSRGVLLPTWDPLFRPVV